MPLKVYKGIAMKDFVVDRLALGYDESFISKDYEAVTGIALPVDEVKDIGFKNEDAVRAKEKQFRSWIESTNLFNQMRQATEELLEQKESAKGDFRDYAILAQQHLRALDMNLRVLEQYKKRETEVIKFTKQNNFLILLELEKDGYLSLNKRDALKKLFSGEDLKDARFESSEGIVEND